MLEYVLVSNLNKNQIFVILTFWLNLTYLISKDDGIETLVSDVHPSKASSSMVVTDDRIETLVSDEHSQKA